MSPTYEDEAPRLIERLRRLKPNKTNEEVIAEWWALRTNPRIKRSLGARSQRIYASQLKPFRAWLAKEKLHVYKIDGDDIVRYWIYLVDDWGLAQNTVFGYTEPVSNLFTYLRDVKRMITDNPVTVAAKHYGVPGTPREPYRALTIAETISLLKTISDPALFVCVLNIFKTLIRKEEYLILLDTDWDPATRRWNVAVHPPKRYVSKVFADEETSTVNNEWLKYKKLKGIRSKHFHPPARNTAGRASASTIDKQLRRAVKVSPIKVDWNVRSDIPGLHTGRRTGTGNLRLAGCPDFIVAEARGDRRQSTGRFHNAPQPDALVTEPMQETYTQVPALVVRDHIDKFMPKFGAVELWMDLIDRQDDFRKLESALRSRRARS